MRILCRRRIGVHAEHNLADNPDGHFRVDGEINGPRQGRVLRGVPVLAGTMSAMQVGVGTGLFAQNDTEALLGQSFLSQFDVILRKDHMVIKHRAR